jgi:hypothetical protein
VLTFLCLFRIQFFFALCVFVCCTCVCVCVCVCERERVEHDKKKNNTYRESVHRERGRGGSRVCAGAVCFVCECAHVHARARVCERAGVG